MQIGLTMAMTLFSGFPCGWAVGVQLHPDSPVLMKKFPVLVVWYHGCNLTDRIRQQHNRSLALVRCASPHLVLLPLLCPVSCHNSLYLSPDTGVPVLLPRGYICVDVNHVLHPFYNRNRFDAGPVRLASIVHAYNYWVAVL